MEPPSSEAVEVSAREALAEDEEANISIADAATESPLSGGANTSTTTTAASAAVSTGASTQSGGGVPTGGAASTPTAAPTARRVARNLLRREVRPLAPLTSRLSYEEQRARILADDDDRLLERLDTMACAVPQVETRVQSQEELIV